MAMPACALPCRMWCSDCATSAVADREAIGSGVGVGVDTGTVAELGTVVGAFGWWCACGEMVMVLDVVVPWLNDNFCNLVW